MFIVPISQITPVSSIFETQKVDPANQLTSGIPFADVLADAVKSTREMQDASKQDAYDLAMGRTDDLSSMMIQSNKASVALDMTIQLTTRAVNAYKEIMQMQA